MAPQKKTVKKKLIAKNKITTKKWISTEKRKSKHDSFGNDKFNKKQALEIRFIESENSGDINISKTITL